ncbi:sulfate ABC transporter permease subunit CysT [Planctomicrobium sp. SH664]|uniref:sulfate ABC transporter permease subunit CysT n=1 Tax=Planctomicrobium sp. SH664 TaxID=3448125 RepID=UPI003F5C0E15
MFFRRLSRSPLPGFLPSLSFTLLYLTLLLVIPLIACIVKASSLSLDEFWKAVWSERARAAYLLTFGASAVAGLASAVLGLLLAWVLVRYQFPGRNVLDALIDIPFALPTAVAGLVYSSLYVQNGWYGQFLVPLGIHGAYSRLAIVLVLTFLGLPFVVRTVQPLLESLESDLEEVAASLGATRWQTFTKVLFPSLLPGLVTGFALSFARGLGEYGSVVFVSGNKPFQTEIAPMLIVAKLEEFAYPEATAIAMVLLAGSFFSLGVINWLDARSRRYAA